MFRQTLDRLRELRETTNSDRLALGCAAYFTMALVAFVITVSVVEKASTSDALSQMLGSAGLAVFGIPLCVSFFVACTYCIRRQTRDRWVWVTLNFLLGLCAIAGEFAVRVSSQ